MARRNFEEDSFGDEKFDRKRDKSSQKEKYRQARANKRIEQTLWMDTEE